MPVTPTSSTFPIEELLPDLRSHLRTRTRLVLEAPPGAGKTTQVPTALLDEPWCVGKKILMLEPRRVAARAAAGFMAQQRGEDVGDCIGYRIRFENKVSPRTRVEVVTEGILTRMLQDDPLLEGVAAILFDEFHERHLSGDLGLALALDVQSQLREDLRIVVMSATLDGEKLARFLDAERLTSAGRSFPVSVQHFPARRDEAMPLQCRRAIEQALAAHAGDVLVFLPGQREISQLQRGLENAIDPSVQVLALHGELPIEQQSAALRPDAHGRRRVILATNLAESSVTLPGVRVVIDSGQAREPRFDPNSGFSRLETVAISQASADQRAGRAGRVAEGWCYRLWPASQRLEPSRSAEIQNVDLAGLALELAAWGSESLRFLDAPPSGTFAAAKDLLTQLGAFDTQQRITAFGKKLLAMGTHPRLAAMLLAASTPRAQALACDLAALLEARDPLVGHRGEDWQSRWRALAAHRAGRSGRDGTPLMVRSASRPQAEQASRTTSASTGVLSAIDHAAANWRRRLRCESRSPENIEAHELGDLLTHAFPDRIARQHPVEPLRYPLSNGRSARLFEDSPLRGEPWLCVSELRFDAKDSQILRAAPVDEAFLRREFPDRFVSADQVRWDSESRALIARREERFMQIVLSSKSAGRPDAKQAAQALCDAVAELGIESLPWTDSLRQWRHRVRTLREAMPELELPDVGDEALLAHRERWLKPALQGKFRLDALSEEELGEALKAEIPWAQRQAIDQHAPRRISVPSGMERGIEYFDDAPPVLAVKLQELFGLADTPKIAGGRIPLTLHLLSPGGKPLQITRDLKSFWERTYPEVKKEMKGRYPRHPWPDDPWSATATHRAKPRGT